MASSLPSLPQLTAHLDLKGVQLHPEALFRTLEQFAALGYEAVLVEYEDIFPFEAEPVALHQEEVWSREFLREFLKRAGELELEVIPLQQCLGHLEYAFRWPCYQEHCLPLGYPSTLHIGREQSRAWLAERLVAVIRAHPESRWIHLGMDEAEALVLYARERGEDPLLLFLEYLESLCVICEAEGVRPLIWADMLERYLSAEAVEAVGAFRHRISLISWNYHGPWQGGIHLHPTTRFAGLCASPEWLGDARDPQAPEGLNDALRSFDEWPAEIAALAAPYRVGRRSVKAFFPAAVWKEAGFHVLGGCGIVTSADGAVLPLYHRRMANVETWVEARREYALDGLVVTAWARGDTYRAPNALPDAAAPLWEYAALKSGRGWGGKSFAGFAPSVPREQLWNLLWKIGRTQQDWYVHRSILLEMERLDPGMQDEAWERLHLLMRILEAGSRATEVMKECEKRFFADRLVPTEWEVRLTRLEAAHAALAALHEETVSRFSPIYHGHALEEWYAIVFCQPLAALEAAQQKAIGFRHRAREFYESHSPAVLQTDLSFFEWK